MEKVRRWIPFVFLEICLSDEKCGYEVVYWGSFAETIEGSFLLGSRKKGRFPILASSFEIQRYVFNCLEQGVV